MNKQELVDAVAATTGASKAATGEAIDAVIAAITGAVTKGDTRATDRLRLVFDGRARRAGRPQSGDRRRNPDPGREDRQVHGGQGVQGCRERRLTAGDSRRPQTCRRSRL